MYTQDTDTHGHCYITHTKSVTLHTHTDTNRDTDTQRDKHRHTTQTKIYTDTLQTHTVTLIINNYMPMHAGTLTINREHIYHRRGEVKGYMLYSMHDSDSMMIAGVILR